MGYQFQAFKPDFSMIFWRSPPIGRELSFILERPNYVYTHDAPFESVRKY
ncbi:MAG: hypothetical protein KME54_23940 [Tolypothrix brevis GSE-NOS-MK-07-07A]|nr:hypothetical protein [Tolypothrix brevis GSE-NOS-MK-07-07A]MBW4477532.1 hypothetical protein [Tolypothrix brevis GSE-NOS-MK-07-07A]MBW4479814.1 hypothetical protein [Tolypothrix brevis GSE-NOS-MK-07-07A]